MKKKISERKNINILNTSNLLNRPYLYVILFFRFLCFIPQIFNWTEN